MKLEKFIQKYGLNLYRYLVKGYCSVNTDGIEHLLFFIEDMAKNKLSLYFIDTKETILLKDVYKMKNYDIPLIMFDDKKLDFELFYRPIGVFQVDFKLSFGTNGDPTKVTSDVFDIVESADRKTTQLIIHDLNRYLSIDKNKFFENMSKKCWLPDEMIVHNGKMHTDDIMAAGLAKYFNPKIKITRTRNIPENFNGLVADVGDGRYDHHKERIYRVNKSTGLTCDDEFGNTETYAAFGLLAKDILPGLLGDKIYYTIDHQFISALDNSDNYGTFNDVCYLFESFNPAWNSDETTDEAFKQATDIAKIFIGKIIEKEIARAEAMPYVKKAIQKMNNNILILDKRAPWQGMARKSTALLCVYPVDDGYAIQTVQQDSSDARDKSTKILLPEEWLVSDDKELLFCHQELFFCVFKTKEKAIEMANEVVNSYKN